MACTNRTIRGWVPIALLAGSILALACSDTATRTDDPATTEEPPSIVSLVPPPDTFDKLLEDVELIVLGTVVGLDHEAMEGPYDEDYPRDPRPNVPQLEPLPFAYYGLAVNEIISSSEATNVDEGDVVTLRVNGAHSSTVAFGGRMLMPRGGDQRLYLLVNNPDGESFGVTAFKVIDLTGDQPRFGDEDRTPVGQLLDVDDPSTLTERLREEHRGATPAQ